MNVIAQFGIDNKQLYIQLYTYIKSSSSSQTFTVYLLNNRLNAIFDIYTHITTV